MKKMSSKVKGLSNRMGLEKAKPVIKMNLGVVKPMPSAKKQLMKELKKKK